MRSLVISIIFLSIVPPTVFSVSPQALRPSSPSAAAEALQQKVDAAIASRAASLTIPGGDYTFNDADFNIFGATGLQILAPQPVKLVFSGKAGVNISDSTNLSLGNWTIDYDPFPFGLNCAHWHTGITLNLLNCTAVDVSDVVIHAAPYFVITGWNGGGGHTFRRIRFVPLPGRLDPKVSPCNGPCKACAVAPRDALHFSDMRVGPKIVDSTIGYTSDDFFNIHTSLLLVLSCQSSLSSSGSARASGSASGILSCFLVNPHTGSLGDYRRNTYYGTNSLLGAVVPGDRMSFWRWPQEDMQLHQLELPSLASSSVEVVSLEQVSEPAVLADASRLPAELEASKQPHASKQWEMWTNASMPFRADEVWRVTFNHSSPITIPRRTLVQVDTISNSGAELINNTFTSTACNLGRWKSSGGRIVGNRFDKAYLRNLEITSLAALFFEGPASPVEGLEIIDNTFIGEGPSPIHCGPLCERFGCGGTWWQNASTPPACARCPVCEDGVDTPWVKRLRMHNNTIIPWSQRSSPGKPNSTSRLELYL